MTTDRITARLNSANARVGQYVVLDPMYQVVRVTRSITSFAAMTYQRTAGGWDRVC